MNRNQLMAAVVIVAMLCAGTAVLTASDASDGESGGGALRVEASYCPAFDYSVGSEYAGIEVDMLRAVCKDMGYNVEFKMDSRESVILSIKDGDCLIGAGGFSACDAELEGMLLTDGYADIRQVVLAPIYTDIAALDDAAGRRISVLGGSIGEELARRITDDVVVRESPAEAADDIRMGRSDCAFLSAASALAYAGAQPLEMTWLDIIAEQPANPHAFLFAKTNRAFCEKFNASLQNIKDSGLYDDILAYYEEHSYAPDTPSFTGSEGGPDGFWERLKDDFYNDFIKNDRYSYIFQGLKNTLIIAAVALVIGMVLGTLVAMVRSVHDQTGKLKALNAIGVLYTTIIRGTPVMVQLMLIYYVVFASSTLNSVMVASVAFGLNSGAYVAEVVRAGINAVPKGQMEACRSLGMSNGQAMSSVILPQAVRNILPALGNEGISLLKETSVAGYIGVMDLTRGADIIRGQTYDALLPMLIAALIYLAIVLVLALLIKKMERRLNDAY